MIEQQQFLVAPRPGARQDDSMKMPILAFTMSMMFVASGAGAHGPAAKSVTNSAAVPMEAAPAVAIVDEFHAALARGDERAALALLSPDVLIFESGGAERSAAEYAAHHLPADAKFAAATAHTISSRTASRASNAAWVTTEGQTTGSWKGKPIDSLSTETMLLIRTAQGWRIKHIHWSSQLAPKAATKP